MQRVEFRNSENNQVLCQTVKTQMKCCIVRLFIGAGFIQAGLSKIHGLFKAFLKPFLGFMKNTDLKKC